MGTSLRRRHRPRVWPWLCLAPTIAVLLLFNYWPLAQTFYLSTQRADLFGRPAGFVGAENYIAMLQDPAFQRTMITTIVFVVLSVVGKIVVGMALALPLSRRLRGTGFARTAILAPMAASTAVAGLAFRAMMTPTTGVLDQLSIAITGSPAGWLTDPQLAVVSIVLVDIWTAIAFMTLLFIAAIDAVPVDVLEAAAIDGATYLRRLVGVILPLISPTMFFVIVTQTMEAMRQYTVISVLTGGGPGGATRVLTFDIWETAFGGTADYSAAAARGVVLLVLIAIMTAVQFGVLERKVNY